MVDPVARGIAEALRRWNEAPAANVIPFPTPSERSTRWMKKWTRPMDDKPRPPHNNPPPSAA